MALERVRSGVFYTDLVLWTYSMSKRRSNRKGKNGRSKHNSQWMREHGLMSAKRQRNINAMNAPKPIDKVELPEGYF